MEIGSGTGQHAVHFAPNLPHLIWQCADQPNYHLGINQWINDHPSTNLRPPIELSIGDEKHDFSDFDGIFTANTAHIMQKIEVRSMMESISDTLPSAGVFCQYGPFTEQSRFSSDSNARFHHQLVSQGFGGYRSVEELQHWGASLVLKRKVYMPANNLLLVWQQL